MKNLVSILLLVSSWACFGQDEEYQQFVLRSSVPEAYGPKIYSLAETYNLNGKLNPFYLQGDFNGDGKLDYAFSVQKKSNLKIGIMIFTSRDEFIVLGCGNPMANRLRIDEFGFMDAWQVSKDRKPEKGVGETQQISLIGDAILAIKTESSSGLIYWNGKEYLWYQQGD